MISVVVPAYNAGDTIGIAIESIFRQTKKIEDIVVVDDGSTDGSFDEVAKFGSRVRLVRQENKGVSAARNLGLRLARGDLITFLDADDVWLPEKTEKQVRFMAEHPECVLVHGELGYIDESGRDLGEYWPDWIGAEGDCFSALYEANRLTTICVMVRKWVLDRVGGFIEEEINGEDYHMWLKCAAVGPFGFIPERLALYRIVSGSRSKDVVKTWRSLLFILEDIERRFPEAVRRVGWLRRVQRKSGILRRLAHELEKEGREGEASEAWGECFRTYWYDPYNWLYLLDKWLPPEAVKAYRWQLKNRFGLSDPMWW